MATTYSIYPAIGIARVGNSPDEFFIGPERIGERPNPTGGFKDAQCRIKRQAARFRIFAHHDDDTIEEVTDAEAEISWTVHLVNKKAAHSGRGNSEPAGDLTIDPGNRTLDGPNQLKQFDTGQISFSGESSVTVPLGQVRTDDDSHLLVLAGDGRADSPAGTSIGSFWGNDDWYDDIADGPVTATIKLRSDGSEPSVTPAWVITAPPKFAPHQDSVITLYDAVQQAMIDGSLLTAPGSTSYNQHVHPILQRGVDSQWVKDVGGAHTSWGEPVTSNALRNAIFNRIKPPSGGSGAMNMPRLIETGEQNGRLTTTQYAHMERWKDNNYTNDWAGPPAPQSEITPDGMTQAALEACVGGAFYPGIEAGGRSSGDRPITDSSNYADAFRLDHSAVSAGDISASMALPWQADFFACHSGGTSGWWPVPRPDDTIRQGDSGYSLWETGADSYAAMVANWDSLGFVVDQGNQKVEVERCDVASITLLTPYLNFVDVPQGPMGMVREQPLAITFEVISPGGSVTLEYAPGGAPSHPQLVAFNTSDTVGPTAASEVAQLKLWLIFKTDDIGAIPTQNLVVRQAGGTQQWTITVDGNTIGRRTAATALVLDRSGSMSEDRGDGESKHASLQQAASIFVDVMLEGDGAGIVRYNHNAQPLEDVLTLGAGGLSDINRSTIKDTINSNQLDPSGGTSIGDGIFEGRAILNDPTLGPYDEKALVVLTDGKENSDRRIADVAAQINEQTFAVGLGTPQNTSSAALQTISGNNGGYLLVTGAIDQDNRFLLQKYFLQILAGVSNADVVLDPDGELARGQVHRIPFQLTEADSGVDVILLTPYPEAVDFRVQTPNGLILEPWRAQAEPGMRYVLSNGVTYYRFVLPTQLAEGRFEQGGTWHALLRIGKPHLQPNKKDEQGIDRSILQAPPAHRRSTDCAQPSSRPAATVDINDEQFQVMAQLNLDRVSERARTLPYSLVVHSYSNLSLSAEINQAGYEPGEKVTINAWLTESGIPVAADRASVWAEVTAPGGDVTQLPFKAQDDGRFSAKLTAAQIGVYRFRVRANGQTRKGRRFTREHILTAAVWRGGNQEASDQSNQELIDLIRRNEQRWCELLACISSNKVIDPRLEKELAEAGISVDQIRKCLRKYCKSGTGQRRENDG